MSHTVKSNMMLMKRCSNGSTLLVALVVGMGIAAMCVSSDDALAGDGLYQVQEGNKVDDKTLKGWKTWRALACERCHGAAQEGMVGPSLVESLKTLSKEDFHTTLMNGRPEKGMPPFNTSAMVNENWEGLYAYLKGRSDGKIQPGHVYPIQ